jgi:hypothetical protein
MFMVAMRAKRQEGRTEKLECLICWSQKYADVVVKQKRVRDANLFQRRLDSRMLWPKAERKSGR